MESKVSKDERDTKVEIPIWNKFILYFGALALMDYLFGDLFTKGGILSTELLPWWERYLCFAIILLLLWVRWKEDMMKWRVLQRLYRETKEKEN